MVSLREGLDRIVLTVRTKDVLTTYKYCQRTANSYFDVLTKLKFSDRHANVILFPKYPWQTWERDGVRTTTYALKYYLRIDGFRQMRVFLNCQRLYNIIHKLEVYDQRLFDDNVVIPTVNYYLEEFVEMVQDIFLEIKLDYIKHRKVVFGDIIMPDDVVIDIHQLEVVREGIGLHTSDVSETFKRHSRADSITVYHDQVNTHYFNTNYKRQLKMYQKGVGILRMEATFNERAIDVAWNFAGPITQIADSIRVEFDKLLMHMNIPSEWWKSRNMAKKTFIWFIADAINMRSLKRAGEPSVLFHGLMQVLLEMKSWSNKIHDSNEDKPLPSKDFNTLTKWLKRKGLIKSTGMRGSWVPTERLVFLQEIYQRFCETEGWLC